MAGNRGASTIPVRVSDGPVFLSKAHEFLEAAESSIERGNFTAAVGNAVHATIAACDAVASVRLRTRWKGEHPGAADHVAAAGPEGAVCAKSLRRVLPLKHRAEYDLTPVAPSQAVTAVKAATQSVEAAARVVAQLKS